MSMFFLPFGIYNANNSSNLLCKRDEPSILLPESNNSVCDKSDKIQFINNNHTHSVEKVKNAENVYITRTGKCYHKSDCCCLSESKIKISKKQAQKNNYVKCSKCFG